MTSLTTASGTPVGPVPLMSTHSVPPFVVCQTWPIPSPPIVTHASEVFVGLTATPEIQGSPGTCAGRLNGGRLPVAVVQKAPEPVPFLLRQTAPKKLPLHTVPAVGTLLPTLLLPMASSAPQ